MRHLLLIAAAGFGLSACSTYHRPSLEEQIHIVDSPNDVNACRRLGAVSPVVPTSPGFETSIDAMLAATVARGGTDLLLRRTSADWAYVQGVAYRCPFARRERVVSPIVRAKG